MAKIVLGARPKHFKRTITVELPEGGKGSVEMQYIYRTRTEFGVFIDELFKDANVIPPSQSEDDVKFSMAEALAKTSETNADYILKVADGWNLDAEFSRESVKQFCDELPGAALAVINEYRLAITEGRVGN